MKKIILFALFLLPVLSFAQDREIYSKSRIFIHSAEDIARLLHAGIPVDEGVLKKDTYVESIFSQSEIKKIENLGYRVVNIIDDMQAYYEKNIRDSAGSYARNTTCNDGTIPYETPENFSLGSMGGFFTYDEMLAALDEMQNLYPDLISVKQSVGTYQTIENRPIYWVKISDNPETDEDEPEILYTAIHHAREPASMQQLIFYMWYLLENYATDSEVQSLINNTEMYFIPVINVDGYIYNQTIQPNGGGMWRKNRRNNGDGTFGVDLNRNYGYEWGGLGTGTSDSETYPGIAAFSEPETQAIKWFCEQHEFTMAINNHTYSGLLLYPFGFDYNQPTPDNATFEAISSHMVSQNGYINQLSSELYPASGVSDDWMYGDTSTHAQIFAMTPEIGHSFWPAIADIIPICKEMVFHNLAAAHIVHNFATLQDTSGEIVPDLNGFFTYDLKRLGLGGNGNFNVSIVPVSGNITQTGSPNTHENLQINESVSGSISYSLDPGIQAGDTIAFAYHINNGYDDYIVNITKVFGTPVTILDDPADTTNYWNDSNWGISTYFYHSAPASITDSPSGGYTNDTDTRIVLANPVDLTNLVYASVSFYAKWSIESGYDYVQFEVSTDGGATWEPQCGKYTHAGSDSQTGATGEPLYDGEQSDWVQENINLSDYLGQSVLFRFRLVSDSGITGDGFYFDDLKVHAITGHTASLAENKKYDLQLFPNPVKDRLFIKNSGELQILRIKILNPLGKTIIDRKPLNGERSISIQHLTSGIYFIQIYTPEQTFLKKIIKP